MFETAVDREADCVCGGNGQDQNEGGDRPKTQGDGPDRPPRHAGGPRARAVPAVRDLLALAAGIAIWWLVFRVPWMERILRGSSFLLYPLIPLVVVVSGLISMIATNYRFLAAELAWAVGLVVSIGLPPGVTGPERTLALRALLHAGAWFGLIYSPLVLLGIWLVDRLRGIEA